MECASRLDLGKLLNSRELLGEGVEVGVYKGVYSRHLLETWKGETLYMVDVWRPLEDYDDKSNQKDFMTALQCMMTAFKNTFDFKGRAVMIRDSSLSAVNLFQDATLDFVYLDAAHDTESVWLDLCAWFPKVKEGGLLCGHDYLDGRVALPDGTFLCDFGVKKAVDRFARSIDKEIHVTTEDGSFNSWIIEV